MTCLGAHARHLPPEEVEGVEGAGLERRALNVSGTVCLSVKIAGSFAITKRRVNRRS